MEERRIRKIAFGINTVILAMVFGLMAFFKLCDVGFLVYFSIPTSFIYIVGYFLIAKHKMLMYVRMVFSWLTLYMCVTTVCLGYAYGFHLYCFSMIPISFITEYMAYKMHTNSIKAMYFSVGVTVLYLLSTGYVAYFGAVYQRDQKYAAVFWLFNAVTVLGFLTFYTNYLVRTIINSEEKLRQIALYDRLTGLYNRHYMTGFLGKTEEESRAHLAMADIDDFKKINDIYGHNAGDHVLKTVSEKMKSCCGGCTVSRWGGEEFLIFIPASETDPEGLIEGLRSSIASENVCYDGSEIAVTITAGIASRQQGQSIDKWIQSADSRLYEGKHSGKNRVVV